MKLFFRRIHLYMGLATGIIIMITCLSGAILVFETELQHLFFKSRYFVTETGTRLSTDTLLKNAAQALPGAKITGVKIYSDPERTAEVSLSVPEKKSPGTVKSKPAKGKPNEGTRLTAFVNPYTGERVALYNHRKSFFYFTMDVHRWMLGGDTGKMVVGVCTLIFLFILITGIILWWPRNRAILKQRLKIKSDAGFKRLNHDYHVVFGFYSAIFLFVLAFTGLAWSFEWFNKGIYTITKSSMEKTPAPKSADNNSSEKISSEAAFRSVWNQNSNAAYYNIGLPKDSSDAFSVNILSNDAAHQSATDTYFVDAYSGNILSLQKFTDKNLGQRVRATFKPIHVASIYGLPTKIIGLLVCLLGTFFPLSGIIMWVNRTWKKKKAV